MKNSFNRTLTAILVAGLFFAVSAQDSYPSELLLEDIYKNHVFGQKGIKALSWMKDNKGYSTLEVNAEIGGNEIVRYDAKTGRREVLAGTPSCMAQVVFFE